MKLIRVILPFLSILPLFADGDATVVSPSRITLKHIESGGVGYNTGYTTLEAFLCADPNWWSATPFLDARGHIFDNGTWAANGGIGVRGQLGTRVYGLNTYYDYRGTKHLHYNQIGVGLETLGKAFDARINGYLPFCKKMSTPYDTGFGYFSGHYLYLSQKVEFAMKGVDAEVAFHQGDCDSWNFYAAIGPYYFHGGNTSNAWGGKVRASISYKNWISFELIESYDNVFHNNTQGRIALSIPLGKRREQAKAKSPYCSWIQPVARNEIIVLNKKHKHPIAIDPLTGSPYYFVFVNNRSSSAGTIESPYPSLLAAQNNSSPNQIIYVFPGDDTTRNMDHGITLQAGQKLWGSGIAHPLSTTQGSITLPQMSSTSPQITNVDLLGAGATLSTNNEISGITFTQTSGQAIYGVDPASFDLSSCTFIGCGQGDMGIFPIVLRSSLPLTASIENNYFTTNPNGGVYIQLLPGATFSRFTVNNNRADGNQATSGGGSILNIEGHGAIGSCELIVTNNTFENNNCGSVNISDLNSPQEGSFASFQGTFNANSFSGNVQGITFGTNAESCSMSIVDNNLSNCSHGGISILAAAAGTQMINNATILIDSNQIDGGGDFGDAITISPAGDAISITITNNSISNNKGTGFVSFFNQPGPAATLFIANNSIINNQNMLANAAGGISFDGFESVNATIENNQFSNNAQGSSIGRYGSSFMTAPNTSAVIFQNNQLTLGDTFEFDFFGNSPETSCLTITGNTSTMSPTYTYQQQGSGSCFITPCNYDSVNTGDFNLSGTTPSTDCIGSVCP